MDVTLGGYRALRKRYLARRANQFDGGAAGYIARFPNRRLNAQRARVGEGKLRLGRGPRGTDDDDVFNGGLGPLNRDPLLAGELTRLGKHFFNGQGMSLPEQRLNILLRQMNMTRRGFAYDFYRHILLLIYLFFYTLSIIQQRV